MRRRGSQSIAANPVLIGAATTLVVLVAVFLAYNANNGLPFVPTYTLTADVPSAAQLVKGNEVRIGGTRVGVVDKITPKALPNGKVIAQLHMKLETTVKPLPTDSTILIRPRSALGLKYVQITKGKSTDGFDEGATIPIKSATPAPVEFDEFLSTFDEKTRTAAQQQLLGFGNAFAGRGEDLHEAIQAFNPLLTQLAPAMANLADRPHTARALHRGARAHVGDRRPGRRPAGVAVRQPRHDVLRLRVDRPALPAGLDQRRSAGRADRDRGAAQAAPVPGQQRRLLPRAATGRQGAVGRRARPGRRVHGRRPGAEAVGAAQQGPQADLPVAAALRRGPAGRARRPGSQQHGEDRRPAVRHDHAVPDQVQLLDAAVPQRRLGPERGRHQRHRAALHDRRHAAGPQQRGQPVVRPRRRPDARQLPARQPVPEHRRTGPDPGVRGGQRETTRPASRSSATTRATRA